MIRELVSRFFDGEKKYAEFAGLSGDQKPVEGLVTGSKFTEVDTGGIFLFDEVTGAWYIEKSGSKTSIAGAVVVLGSSPVYDGTEKTQSVTSVSLGGEALTANTDYVVSDNKATLPGTHQLRITGIGSYAGIIFEDFTITKASGSVTASPDSLSLTEGGDAGESTLTVVGDGEVSAKSSAEDVATVTVSGGKVTVTPVAEGTATVTVTLADGDLYTGGTDTISVTVAAAEPAPEPDP